MKALVMRAPGEYGVEDVKKPVPGFQEVLVRMHSVAICGSDPPLLAGESLKDGLPAYMQLILNQGIWWRQRPILGADTAPTAGWGGITCALISASGSRGISSMDLPLRDAMPNTVSITYGPSIIFPTA